MVFIWIKFIICAILIVFSGRYIARYGDIISKKTGLGGIWIGVILVAIATSLPEIFIGIGSTVFVKEPDLTVGNLFGANTYNLLNLCFLDFLHKGKPLLSAVSSGQLLTAISSLLPLAIASAGIFSGHKLAQFTVLNVSIFSILITLSFLILSRTIFKFEKKQKGAADNLSKEEGFPLKYEHISLFRAGVLFAVFAAIIAMSGIWLSYIGEEMAVALKLGETFIGSIFLGLVTTLPEIVVSASAVLIGAKDLAVANLLGSNLFNMVIIFFNDLLYRKGSIFTAVSQQHIFTGLIVLVMTSIVCMALILRPSKKAVMGLSGYSIALILVFILGAGFNFLLGN